MVFTRYSAGKTWSLICMQDIVKPELHYQINLIRLKMILHLAGFPLFARRFLSDVVET